MSRATLPYNLRRRLRNVHSTMSDLRKLARTRRDSYALDAVTRHRWGRIAATLDEWDDDLAGIEALLDEIEERERRAARHAAL